MVANRESKSELFYMENARAFTISHTKCKKWAFLEEFRGPFEFFCMDGRRGLLVKNWK
jgi:hypothetical protein